MRDLGVAISVVVTEKGEIIEMKGITRCKLTILSVSAIYKKLLGQIWSYAASLSISNSHSLECYAVIFDMIDLKEYSFHFHGLY